MRKYDEFKISLCNPSGGKMLNFSTSGTESMVGRGGGRGGGEKNVLNVGGWWRHNELLSTRLTWSVEQVMLWP